MLRKFNNEIQRISIYGSQKFYAQLLCRTCYELLSITTTASLRWSELTDRQVDCHAIYKSKMPTKPTCRFLRVRFLWTYSLDFAVGGSHRMLNDEVIDWMIFIETRFRRACTWTD